MNRRTVLTWLVTMVVVLLLLFANDVGAHTQSQQEDWWSAWEQRAAHGLTPELIQEARTFADRHRPKPVAAAGGSGQRGGPVGTAAAAAPSAWQPLVAAYFPPDAVATMTCLIGYESNGNPNAINPRSGARGLLQVMPFWAEHLGIPINGLLDPDTNMRVSRYVWNQQGYRAWSPYKRGLCHGL